MSSHVAGQGCTAYDVIVNSKFLELTQVRK